MTPPETKPVSEERVRTSPTAACADRLVWRASVLLLCGMGLVLILVWDHTVSLSVIGGAGALWFMATGFIYYFFRDPEPNVPRASNVFVAPAHGLVDVIDEASNVEFMGDRCRRISIFLSVFDVHVQYAPAAGRVVVLEHRAGRFLSAVKRQSAHCNENVFIGIECSDGAREHVAVRQIAGVIARRIVSWINPQDDVEPGQRLGLIQFGSRCDLYLPWSAQVKVQRGERVIGGETVIGVAATGQHDQTQASPTTAGITSGPGTPGVGSLKSLRQSL